MSEDEYPLEKVESLAEQLAENDLLKRVYKNNETLYNWSKKGMDLLLEEFKNHLSEIEKAYEDGNKDEQFEQFRHAIVIVIFETCYPDKTKHTKEVLMRIADLSSILLNAYYEDYNYLDMCYMYNFLHTDDPSETEMVEGVMKVKGVPKTTAFSIVAKALRKSTSYVRDHYAG